MAFVLSRTVTKTGNTPFFNVANPAAVGRLKTWTLAQPGVLTTGVSAPNANTQSGIIVFDTMENLNAFRTARASNADFQAREAYSQQNNFVVDETVIS